MKREIRFIPAYDKRHTDPSKNYGVGALQVCFYLTGDEGCVQFTFSTGMYPRHVEAEWVGQPRRRYPDWMAYDIGYHSPEPMYDGQEPITNSCERLDGKPCYYDGSSLNADRYLDALMTEGDEKVWEMIEDYYRSVFHGGIS